MSLATYGTFLGFALVVVLIPGPDFAVISKNTLTGGRTRGTWSALGVVSSCAVQGVAAAAGLGALIVSAQPVFETIKWAGVIYLVFLGVQSIRSAILGRYDPIGGGEDTSRGRGLGGWRQGFVSNITNPKVLVFYLSVLPQFLVPGAPAGFLLVLALSHALLGAVYLLLLVSGLDRARGLLSRRSARRTLDALTGAALLGFGAKLAVEQT